MADKDAAGEPTQRRGAQAEASAAKQQESSVDYARYRMNPVDIEESAEPTVARPRRIAVYAVLVGVIAVAVMVIVFWNRQTKQGSPLQSLDPDVRAQARELVDNILTRIKSLQGIVYDVQYPSPTSLRIFISPTVSERPGVEHDVTYEEIGTVTRRAIEEFRKYGVTDARLEVQAFVVEHPDEAANAQPAAVGTYDPEAKSTIVHLTGQVPLPSTTGTGTAPRGEGHIGEHGGSGMPPP